MAREGEVGDAAGDHQQEHANHREAARPRAWLAVAALAEDVIIHRHTPRSELVGRTTIRCRPRQWSRLDMAARGLWPPGDDRRHRAWHSASRESASVPEGFTMSPRTMPPFRADHVGSFLRPAELQAARKDHAAGVISDEQLRAVERSEEHTSELQSRP